MISLRRIRSIQTAYSIHIERAAHDFGDHEGVATPKVTRWMAQFRNRDLELAVKILREIKYYSAEKIRAMVNQLVGLTYHHFDRVQRDRILFIPVGKPYEGSTVIARALRDEIGDERRIKEMADLEKLSPASFDALVFLDDFSGTGSSLKDWWDNVEMLIRPKNVPFVVALLVLNSPARDIVQQFSQIICVDELTRRHNVISEKSRTFTDAEKQRLIYYCHLTGCDNTYLLGYGGCGLLVAFKHQCPDNSLPILWHTSEHPQWEGLFKQSGL